MRKKRKAACSPISPWSLYHLFLSCLIFFSPCNFLISHSAMWYSSILSAQRAGVSILFLMPVSFPSSFISNTLLFFQVGLRVGIMIKVTLKAQIHSLCRFFQIKKWIRFRLNILSSQIIIKSSKLWGIGSNNHLVHRGFIWKDA